MKGKKAIWSLNFAVANRAGEAQRNTGNVVACGLTAALQIQRDHGQWLGRLAMRSSLAFLYRIREAHLGELN